MRDRARHLGVVRVATKYPNIASAYFEREGIAVEMVKLHGNIELAPLIGLADWIVDITATGTTLRAEPPQDRRRRARVHRALRRQPGRGTDRPARAGARRHAGGAVARIS